MITPIHPTSFCYFLFTFPSINFWGLVSQPQIFSCDTRNWYLNPIRSWIEFFTCTCIDNRIYDNFIEKFVPDSKWSNSDKMATSLPRHIWTWNGESLERIKLIYLIRRRFGGNLFNLSVWNASSVSLKFYNLFTLDSCESIVSLKITMFGAGNSEQWQIERWWDLNELSDIFFIMHAYECYSCLVLNLNDS